MCTRCIRGEDRGRGGAPIATQRALHGVWGLINVIIFLNRCRICFLGVVLCKFHGTDFISGRHRCNNVRNNIVTTHRIMYQVPDVEESATQYMQRISIKVGGGVTFFGGIW